MWIVVQKQFFASFIEFLECTDDTICDPNASCNNVTGTPVCTCNDGFVEDGDVCEGKNLKHILNIL